MNRWLIGARLRTLPAAVVPVALGAAAAVGENDPVWWRVGGALVVSLALQVGVNYANDYSDGVRGTDAVRVGPTRLLASGLATASAVKRAALAAFAIAALSGLVLAAVTSWWLLAVGAAALLAGWGYTGGPKPYGYFGLGELFVFVFFGLVATAGTTFVVCERITATSWLAGCIAGCLACALLVINNLRDIPTDRVAGKRTLAVRIGDRRTRALYVVLLVVAFAIVIAIAIDGRPWTALGLAGALVAIVPMRTLASGAQGGALIPVLGATGKVQLATGLLAAAGIALGG
ncbi:MAG: 1,4-dihydroxy-2-naphthoate polyprenyltransferase [Ilumatobacteraceae bacterium]